MVVGNQPSGGGRGLSLRIELKACLRISVCMQLETRNLAIVRSGWWKILLVHASLEIAAVNL